MPYVTVLAEGGEPSRPESARRPDHDVASIATHLSATAVDSRAPEPLHSLARSPRLSPPSARRQPGVPPISRDCARRGIHDVTVSVTSELQAATAVTGLIRCSGKEVTLSTSLSIRGSPAKDRRRSTPGQVQPQRRESGNTAIIKGPQVSQCPSASLHSRVDAVPLARTASTIHGLSVFTLRRRRRQDQPNRSASSKLSEPECASSNLTEVPPANPTPAA